MRRTKATFSVIFDRMKTRIAKNNLTLGEVALNSGMPEELLALLLNPDNDIVDSISRLFEFNKINLYSGSRLFYMYRIAKNGTQLKITRIIDPKCSIYFDNATSKFYKFTIRNKRNVISNNHKQLIMSEMKEFLENYLD